MIIGELLLPSHAYSPLPRMFSVDLRFQPYLLGDILLALLIRVFSLRIGSFLWVSLCFLAFPLGFLFYVRSRKSDKTMSIFWGFCTLYLATNWCFLTGFLNYCLGVGLAFLTLGFLEYFVQIRIGRERNQLDLSNNVFITTAPSFLTELFFFLCFFLSALCTYLIHFASFLFLFAIVTTMLFLRFLFKLVKLGTTLLCFLPFVYCSTLRLLDRAILQDYVQPWLYRSLQNKILALGTMFIRYDYTTDIFLFGVFAVLGLSWIIGYFKTRPAPIILNREATLELLIVTALFILGYLMLPVAIGTLYDVDVRALPFIVIFALLSVCSLTSLKSEGLQTVFVGAFLLNLCNWFYLNYYLTSDNARLEVYQEALLKIPPRKSVLSIATWANQGRMQVGFHDAALYTALKEGFTPYIFSSTLGEPCRYFHYLETRYTPNPFWYLRNEAIDWEQVKKDYDYLIIAKPFERIRLPSEGLEEYYENDTAKVFIIAQ